MFQDIRLSTNLIEEYKTYCENKKLTNIGMINQRITCFRIFVLVDFSVMVLSSNSWPFTAPPTFNLSIEVIFE
jgi:hypothetical protein